MKWLSAHRFALFEGEKMLHSFYPEPTPHGRCGVRAHRCTLDIQNLLISKHRIIRDVDREIASEDRHMFMSGIVWYRPAVHVCRECFPYIYTTQTLNFKSLLDPAHRLPPVSRPKPRVNAAYVVASLQTADGQPTESNKHSVFVVRAGLVGRRLEIP
ncbi:hypothetical protein J6590_067473 [Homalodisca vitripennis]|nr:hypothetical protein J6590_067473 [Homalodisca vitripennis]